MEKLRNEYPRPQFMRKEWKNLNMENGISNSGQTRRLSFLLYFRAV